MTMHTYTLKKCSYQLSTCYTLQFPRYSPDKILKYKVTRARSKVKSRSHHNDAHLHPQPMFHQVSDSLRFPCYRLDKIFKLKVTTARSKVKSRSDHDGAHQQPQTNVRTTYQLHSPYGFSDKSWTKFSNSGHYGKVKGQIMSYHHIAHLQPSTNVPSKYKLPTPCGF